MKPPEPHTQGDAHALRRIGQRLARGQSPPWLHGEVARRMAERLPLLAAPPRTWIDWWPTVGATPAALQESWPAARRVVVEPDEAAARRHAAPRGWRQRLGLQRAPAQEVLVGHAAADTEADLIWASMALHLAPDSSAWLAQWHAALRVDGVLMLSTFGPATLAELQSLYDEAGWGPAHAPFEDMHDLGDRLVGHGFADPVVDQEVLTLHWSSAQTLLSEIRALGGNAHPLRHAGCRTPRWRDRLLDALSRRADARGRIPMRFEVVYAQAFKAPLRQPPGEARIDPDELRRQLRLRRAAGDQAEG